MLSLETKKEILKKLADDKETPAMFSAHDIQGIAAKCAEAGFEVTRGDVEELFLTARDFSDDALDAVAGGFLDGSEPNPGGCAPREAFLQPPY